MRFFRPRRLLLRLFARSFHGDSCQFRILVSDGGILNGGFSRALFSAVIILREGIHFFVPVHFIISH